MSQQESEQFIFEQMKLSEESLKNNRDGKTNIKDVNQSFYRFFCKIYQRYDSTNEEKANMYNSNMNNSNHNSTHNNNKNSSNTKSYDTFDNPIFHNHNDNLNDSFGDGFSAKPKCHCGSYFCNCEPIDEVVSSGGSISGGKDRDINGDDNDNDNDETSSREASCDHYKIELEGYKSLYNTCILLYEYYTICMCFKPIEYIFLFECLLPLIPYGDQNTDYVSLNLILTKYKQFKNVYGYIFKNMNFKYRLLIIYKKLENKRNFANKLAVHDENYQLIVNRKHLLLKGIWHEYSNTLNDKNKHNSNNKNDSKNENNNKNNSCKENMEKKYDFIFEDYLLKLGTFNARHQLCMFMVFYDKILYMSLRRKIILKHDSIGNNSHSDGYLSPHIRRISSNSSSVSSSSDTSIDSCHNNGNSGSIQSVNINQNERIMSHELNFYTNKHIIIRLHNIIPIDSAFGFVDYPKIPMKNANLNSNGFLILSSKESFVAVAETINKKSHWTDILKQITVASSENKTLNDGIDNLNLDLNLNSFGNGFEMIDIHEAEEKKNDGGGNIFESDYIIKTGNGSGGSGIAVVCLLPDMMSDECMMYDCKNKFDSNNGKFGAKYHCRVCGRLACYQCIQHKMQSYTNRDNRIRVCKDCLYVFLVLLVAFACVLAFFGFFLHIEKTKQMKNDTVTRMMTNPRM